MEIHGLLRGDDSKQGTHFCWETNCPGGILMINLVCGHGLCNASLPQYQGNSFFFLNYHVSHPLGNSTELKYYREHLLLSR